LKKFPKKGELARINIFESYANYYDIIYQDKDYKAESHFLGSIFSKYISNSRRSILDLGCGTGGHALILAEKGYKVTGIDLSRKMLEIGERKAKKRRLNIKFIKGDIRNTELNQKFDAVISMFAVMSYQVANQDLISTFKTAWKHLKKNGLFIFDIWFGPAVLTQKPSDRFKVIEKDNERIIRFATPVLDILNHTVDVKYKIIKISKDKVLDEVDEVHRVRFLFPQEIKLICEMIGFEILELCPFMKLGKTPSEQDWNVTVVAERR